MKLTLTGIIALAALGLLLETRGSRTGDQIDRTPCSIGLSGGDITLWPLLVRKDGSLRTYAKVGLCAWFGVMLVVVWTSL